MIMKKLFLLVALSPWMLKAQDYNVNKIPEQLKKEANVIKRMEEWKIVIKNAGKASVKHKYALTILNESGNRFAYYSNSYDKLQSLEDITGHLYDAEGKELKKVKKKDIQDVSYDDDMSLMTDNRLKQHTFYYRTYPYTVEYEDEQNFDGIFFLPHWQPIEGYEFSVQQSAFIVEVPADYQLRYKQFNYTGAPTKTEQGKTTIHKWEVLNQEATNYEPNMPRFAEVTTSVFIAPASFEIGGYNGDMSSWEGLGKFILSLNKNRDALPDNIKADIHRIADAVSDKQEKIRLLYEYMQKNTRYISVQMGIGSWQPFDAKYVATKRYGDCKALSNYMVSILKEAGINANYVLINSGEGRKGLWEDFPAPYFNHAIMCVPDGKDTLWLECTSQTRSAGFMGSSTGNRKALMIDENGGTVVRTPFYSVLDNLQMRKIKAVVDAEGNISIESSTRFTGQQQEQVHGLIYGATSTEREKYLNESISLPTYKVESSTYKEQKGKVPAVNEYLKITASNYATITGKRLFLQPNLFNKSGTKLPTDKPRKYDLQYDYSYKDVDTISIAVPDGYVLEALPKNVNLESKCGKYSISFKLDGSSIEVLRVNEKYAGVYPSTEYLAIAKFMEDIYKADRGKVVLVKKE
jgi:hypothetical protein